MTITVYVCTIRKYTCTQLRMVVDTACNIVVCCREPYLEVLTEKGLPVDNEKIGCTFALFTVSPVWQE